MVKVVPLSTTAHQLLSRKKGPLCKATNSLAHPNNSLFMCQDEDENEDEDQRFGSFWKYCVTNKPIL